MAQTTEASGGCLCRAVRYEITGPMRRVVYCHCEQCRKTSGHFVAATSVQTDELHISEDSGLEWYQSSDIADRGFCRRCCWRLLAIGWGEGELQCAQLEAAAGWTAWPR